MYRFQNVEQKTQFALNFSEDSNAPIFSLKDQRSTSPDAKSLLKMTVVGEIFEIF